MSDLREVSVKDQGQIRADYLGLIQGNISRMAGNSAIMKGFAAAFMAAILEMSVAESVKWYYILAAAIPLIAFVRLDIYYLQLEKRYRNLYSLVINKKINSNYYVLDFASPVLEKRKKELFKNSGFFKTMCSVSIWQFYIWFIVLIVALIIFVN